MDKDIPITKGNNKLIEFIADSGATEHLSKSKMYFSEFRADVKSRIECANKDSDFEAGGLGKTNVITKDNNTFILNNILYAKDLSNNLLSLRRFVDQGLEVCLNNKIIDIYDPELNKGILSGEYKKPFWTLKLVIHNALSDECISATKSKIFYNTRSKRNLKVTESIEKTIANKERSNVNENFVSENLGKRKAENEFLETTENRKTHVVNVKEKEMDNHELESILPINKSENYTESMLWHMRLGHVSKTYLLALAKNNYNLLKVDALLNDTSIQECKICLQANSIKLPFTKIRMRATKPLQIVHGDTMGPISPISHPGKYKFVLVLIDDATRAALAFPIQCK